MNDDEVQRLGRKLVNAIEMQTKVIGDVMSHDLLVHARELLRKIESAAYVRRHIQAGKHVANVRPSEHTAACHMLCRTPRHSPQDCPTSKPNPDDHLGASE